MDAIFSSALDRAWCPLRNKDNCDFGDSGEGEKNQGLIADQRLSAAAMAAAASVLAIAQALAEIFTTSQYPYCTSRAFYSLSLSLPLSRYSFAETYSHHLGLPHYQKERSPSCPHTNVMVSIVPLVAFHCQLLFHV